MPIEDDAHRRVRGLLESNKALRGAILARGAEIERLVKDRDEHARISWARGAQIDTLTSALIKIARADGEFAADELERQASDVLHKVGTGAAS